MRVDRVERSRQVLTNPRIQSSCLDVGPMALTGSTRMQASTVLMLVVGLALEFVNLIQNQRGFQANAKTITTTDEMLNEVINIKR